MSQCQEHSFSFCDSNPGEADSDSSSSSTDSGGDGDEGRVDDPPCIPEPDCLQPNASHKSIESCLSSIEILERTCSDLNTKCKQQQDNLEEVAKKYALAVKDRELMVMRYAVGEKLVLELKRAKEDADKQHKELNWENGILQRKVSVMGLEKERICQMLDGKVHELRCAQQEIDKAKSDVIALETELKWSRNALKAEKEMRKDSDMKVDSLRVRVQEQVSEIEQAKHEAQELIRTFYSSQENRANVLEQQLQEQQATLILLRHEKEDKEKITKSQQAELEILHSKEKELSEENHAVIAKLQNLEKEHLEMSNKFEEMHFSHGQLQKHNCELQQLTIELERDQKHKFESDQVIESLQQRISEFQIDLDAYRERESDLLAFTEQLTGKNVHLLSEFTTLETKVQQLKCEQDMLQRMSKEYESKVDNLTKQLVHDRYKYDTEIAEFTNKLETKTKQCEILLQEVIDQKGENAIIKRKYEQSLKEVNKELQLSRRKIDQYETASQSSNGSSSSLNVIDQPNAIPDGDQVRVIQPELTLDKKALVERIVKLQRISARKSEKIDFLEEHINALVVELQRKTHLLQDYILREQTGALTSNKMDKNKANIAKLNGIMASVYGSRVADSNLTLELSLDINHKLQAVVEDALLKNITLKENIDTLGGEIDRLNNLLKSSSYSNTVNI